MSIQSINTGAQVPPSHLRSAGPSDAPPGGAAPVSNTAKATEVREATATQGSTAQPSREQVLQAVEEVRAAIEPVAQNLLFSIDDDTGRTVIKIIDSSNDEVIRQIPSEEMLAISKALDKLQGLLIKQEV